ncbi:hypothetical protein D7X30_29940 [Corallococcus sp. AB011P]|uniref:hypothetical protein n=1 Tax=Corallococcus sp. AB011P TaxID=2316735 RepID=UPI000EA175BE|nr:hypothetical protein [Corallococcus sp. AB011P]RKG54202.1 hypothetical protein D7X30_29940 [Corallococcus sp. AB011P]
MSQLNLKRCAQALVITSLLAGCGGTDTGEPAAHEPVTQAAQHCVMNVMPFTPGEPLPASDTVPAPKCFTSFPEAISFATGGTVRLPATANPKDLKESDLKSVHQAAPNEIVIGIEYEDRWTASAYSGNSIVFVSTYGGCGSLFVPSMPAGWNDIISSSRSFAGCNHSYHYQNDNGPATGPNPSIDCGGGCTGMGVMDNQTSSIFWTQ